MQSQKQYKLQNCRATPMIEVAKIGKTVGVHGGLKIYPLTDFPQIFTQDVIFSARKGDLAQQYLELRIKSYKDGIAHFVGYESLESAKTLTNAILSMSLEDTKKLCPLKEGEMFWFDVLGCEIIEDGECLGCVKDIERIGSVDYLMIKARSSDPKLPKTFMIPYIDRYVISSSKGKIYTQGAKDIWLES